jgi:hypothetical protein
MADRSWVVKSETVNTGARKPGAARISIVRGMRSHHVAARRGPQVGLRGDCHQSEESLHVRLVYADTLEDFACRLDRSGERDKEKGTR